MAARFWVGGTGTWDSSSTTHWGSSSGTADNASVPGASDAVTFDASSGGGTVTLNFGGTITIQSITMGAFTGTWDNSVNNNNMTLSAAAGFNCSGSGARTVKLGSATYSLSTTGVNATPCNFVTSTNLTLTGGSETWVISGVTQNQRLINCSTSVVKAFGALVVNANCGLVSISGIQTYTTITLNGGTSLNLQNTLTATSLNWNASGTGKQILIVSGSIGFSTTVSVASGTQNMSWCAFRDIAFTGGATFIATSSFDLGDNSGLTITGPASSLAPAPVVIARGTPY